MTEITLTSIGIAIGSLVAALAVGFLLEGVERKLYARLQNRKGPPILQPVYDALKLLFAKETVVPRRAAVALFAIAPYVSVAAILTAVLLIPLGGIAPFSFSGDLIVVLYVLALAALAVMVGASASGSPFAAVGVSRERTLFLSIELPLILAVLAAAFAAGSFSLAGISNHFHLLPLAAIAFFLVSLAELGKTPFDIAEAEQEIAEGIFSEYSGKLLGLFRVAIALKHYVYASLFSVLFIPMPVAWGFWMKAGVQLVVALLLVCAMAFVRSASARFRIHGAAGFYLSWVSLIAVLQLVVVYLWR